MKINQFVAYALLLLIAAGAQPAYSAYWQWSKTAATNATADPTINWSEGMAPSAINDSARAQMAREAEQRDDQSGSLTTGGTSTAYTVTSNQGMCLSPSTTPQVGQSIAMTMHTTNGASPTLGVDGCTVYPIQSGGAAVAAGILIANNPYTFKFNGSAWILAGRYNYVGVVTVKKQIFTASGTYTPSTGMLQAIIECVGSGGGGGGVAGTPGTTVGAGGGGGGSYSRVVATSATIGASQAVTIGTVGTGGTAGANPGGAATDTSVGTLCIGKGGSGGGGANSGTPGQPGLGGVAGTGDLTVPGGNGGSGILVTGSAGSRLPAGAGGASGHGFGFGGKAAPPLAGGFVVGQAGGLYGGGGSGADVNDAASNTAGGAGGLGVVFITEFNSQ